MRPTRRLLAVIGAGLVGVTLGYAVTSAMASPFLPPVDPIVLDPDEGETSTTETGSAVTATTVLDERVVPPPTLGPLPQAPTTQPQPSPQPPATSPPGDDDDDDDDGGDDDDDGGDDDDDDGGGDD